MNNTQHNIDDYKFSYNYQIEVYTGIVQGSLHGVKLATIAYDCSDEDGFGFEKCVESQEEAEWWHKLASNIAGLDEWIAKNEYKLIEDGYEEQHDAINAIIEFRTEQPIDTLQSIPDVDEWIQAMYDEYKEGV